MKKEDMLDNLTQDSWRMFKIISEVVEGFETLSNIRNGISIFGSARVKEGEPFYEETVEIAKGLASAGYDIITGGGPGLMEAGNKGAVLSDGKSVGLHIHLPHEQSCNNFVKTRVNFRYFFVRKFMFVKYTRAYVVMPGGMGTLDEISEAFVLMQTKRTKTFPIILYNSKFWGGMLDWIKDSMVKGGYVNESELSLLRVEDTPEDVINYIRNNVSIEPKDNI